jgi:uncharacterized protein YjbI with pentapeptide repeats
MMEIVRFRDIAIPAGPSALGSRHRAVPVRRTIGAVLLLAAGFWGAPALADCAEPPQPGVDWRGCTMHSREFVDADLSQAKLRDGRFTRADFSNANLSGIDGRRAKFIDAVARKTSFEGARLSGADFTNADLAEANFKNADLYRAQFQGANLRGVNLTGAKIESADMADADLSGARWIDGKTICAEGSIGQCKLEATPERVSG